MSADPQQKGASTSRSVGRGAAVMAAMTILSRITGFLRDRAFAWLLGTSAFADAFYIAYRIPNSFRRFVGEGAMTAAFVPVVTDFMVGDREKLWTFCRRFLWTFSLFMSGLAVLGVFTAHWLVPLVAQRTAADPVQLALTIDLTRWLFPYLFLISTSAVLMGILNSHDIFGPSAFTPVLLNLCMIGGAFTAGRVDPDHQGQWLAAGVLVGGFCQVAFQVPYLKKQGMSFKPLFGFGDGVFKVLKLMIPGLLGAGISQITLLVGTFMADLAGEGAVSALFFATRLQELAIGVVAVSIMQAILPAMSRAARDGNTPGLLNHLGFGLRLAAWFMLPATVGLMILGEPVVRVLFQTGRFDTASTAQTAAPLFWLALAMYPWAVSQITTRAFFARKDTKTPAWVSLISLTVFSSIGFYLLEDLGIVGIALAFAVSGTLSAIILLSLLRKQLGPLNLLTSFSFVIRALLFSSIMGAAVFFAHRFLPVQAGLKGILPLGLLVGGGGLLYMGLLVQFGGAEIRGYLMKLIRRGAKANQ